MNKLLLVVIGLLLAGFGFLLGRTSEAAAPANVRAGGAAWNAEAGAYVTQSGNALRLWKLEGGEVVEVTEFSTALVDGDNSAAPEPKVFKRVIKPAPEGATQAVPPIEAPLPPALPQSSCGGSGASCG